MSIIDHVLICIDDAPKSREDLESVFSSYKSSVIFSSVGRLLGKKLIIESGKGSQKLYSVTQKGASLIKESLISIRDIANGGDYVWILVAVSIPDTYKVEREKIRTILKSNGFGLIRSGLYIGNVIDPHTCMKMIQDSCTHTEIIFFTISELPKSILDNPNMVWHTQSIKSNYSKWTVSVKRFLHSLPTNIDTRRIQAKIHVYILSDLIRQDSKIFTKTYAESIHRTESLKLYYKIRDYCYE